MGCSSCQRSGCSLATSASMTAVGPLSTSMTTATSASTTATSASMTASTMAIGYSPAHTARSLGCKLRHRQRYKRYKGPMGCKRCHRHRQSRYLPSCCRDSSDSSGCSGDSLGPWRASWRGLPDATYGWSTAWSTCSKAGGHQFSVTHTNELCTAAAGLGFGMCGARLLLPCASIHGHLSLLPPP